MKAKLQGMRNRIWDEQRMNQVGTDKDYVDLNPDLVPEYNSTCSDTNAIWVSWTGDNANAGTEANPKRSLLDNGYNSAGTGALSAAMTAGFDICFVNGSNYMWVEAVNIPYSVGLYKKTSGDTVTVRTCRRTLPNNGVFKDWTACFVDPNNSSGHGALTKLLIHSNTTDGSTTFTDHSCKDSNITPYNTITAFGNVHHETDQQKFGTTSIEFASASNDYLTASDTGIWSAGDYSFTIDLWIRCKSLPGTVMVILDPRLADNFKRWIFYIDAASKLQFSSTTNGVAWNISLNDPNALVIDTWYHIAVVRNGDDWTLYKDGVAVATTNVAGTMTTDTATLKIGTKVGGGNYFDGYMDEIRIAGNYAQWTANFNTDLPTDFWSPFTQIDPSKSFSRIAKYFRLKGFVKDYMIAFNAGFAGTPGDFTSLLCDESEEVIDLFDQDFSVYPALQWQYDYFTAGDTAFIKPNAGSFDLSLPAFTRGAEAFTLVSNYLCINEINRYMNYSTDGYNFTQVDVTGGAEVLYDLIFWSGYLYCGTATRIRRTNTAGFAAGTWSNASAAIGALRFVVRGSLLYAFTPANGIYSTNNGTTWTQRYTGSVSTLVGKPVLFGDNIYFILSGVLYKMDINYSISAVSNVPANDAITAIELYDSQLHLIVQSGTYDYLYSFDGNSFALKTALPVRTHHYQYLFTYENLLLCCPLVSSVSVYNGDDIFTLPLTAWSNLFQIEIFKNMIFVTDSASNVRFQYLGLLSNIYTGCQVSGLDINGQQQFIHAIAMNSSNNNFTINYNNIYNCLGKALPDCNFGMYEKNIIHDCNAGLESISSSVNDTIIQENLLFNITESAIEIIADGDFVIEHNTIDNCGKGIYINTATIGTLTIKNNILTRLAYFLDSLSVLITTQFTYNLIGDGCSGVNVTPDSTNKTGNAHFRNRDGINIDFKDYRLMIKEILASNGLPYNFNSPGKQMADDSGTGTGYTDAYTYDVGCYLLVRYLGSDTYALSIVFNDFVPTENEVLDGYSNIIQFLTNEGVSIPGYTGQANRINISWEPADLTEAQEKFTLRQILKDSLRIKARFWVNHEFYDSLWLPSTFAALADTASFRASRDAGDMGLYSCGANLTLNLTDLELTNSASDWRYDEFKGWLVSLTLQKSAAPFEFVELIFKIIGNTPDTITLRNVENLDLSSFATEYDSSSDYLGMVVIGMDCRWPVGDVTYWLSDLMLKVPTGLTKAEFDLLEA